jgi:hypothetical protein
MTVSERLAWYLAAVVTVILVVLVLQTYLGVHS